MTTTRRYRIETLDGKPLSDFGFEDFSTDSGARRTATMSALAEYFVGVLHRGEYSAEQLRGGVGVNFAFRVAATTEQPERLERRILTVRTGFGYVAVSEDVLNGVSNYTQNWFNLPDLRRPKVSFSPSAGKEDFFIYRKNLEERAGAEYDDVKIRVPFLNPSKRTSDTRRALDLVTALNHMASKVTPTQHDVERQVNSFFNEWTYAEVRETNDYEDGEPSP